MHSIKFFEHIKRVVGQGHCYFAAGSVVGINVDLTFDPWGK